jgi:hypothetical protein
MVVTPSIFAYSMLYPYSDNYLDDPSIPREEKTRFNARFGRRLAGETVAPANLHEEKIWRLVDLIEGEVSQGGVFAGVRQPLAIHGAQVRSLRLAAGTAAVDDGDVARLIFAKGGASVLADGCLAAGSLAPSEAEFVFLWGVLLQLGDDLQDVGEDRRRGVRTLFTLAARREPLDALTSRAFHFGESVMRRLEGIGAGGTGSLKRLIHRSSRSFLVRCAGEAGARYTGTYLRVLVTRSPVRFGVLEGARERAARRGQAFKRLFEAFLAAGEDEPAFPVLPASFMPRV